MKTTLFPFFDAGAISGRRFKGVDYGKMKVRFLLAQSQLTRKVENLTSSSEQVLHIFVSCSQMEN